MDSVGDRDALAELLGLSPDRLTAAVAAQGRRLHRSVRSARSSSSNGTPPVGRGWTWYVRPWGWIELEVTLVGDAPVATLGAFGIVADRSKGFGLEDSAAVTRRERLRSPWVYGSAGAGGTGGIAAATTALLNFPLASGIGTVLVLAGPAGYAALRRGRYLKSRAANAIRFDLDDDRRSYALDCLQWAMRLRGAAARFQREMREATGRRTGRPTMVSAGPDLQPEALELVRDNANRAEDDIVTAVWEVASGRSAESPAEVLSVVADLAGEVLDRIHPAWRSLDAYRAGSAAREPDEPEPPVAPPGINTAQRLRDSRDRMREERRAAERAAQDIQQANRPLIDPPDE